jgi:DNA topoisomerase-1
MPGIARRRHGRGFAYQLPSGAPVGDRATLERIAVLAIPPAWREVWICPYADGHLQATGRDARGRKQYRYHRRWRRVRDATKFERLAAFGRRLPVLRRRLQADLAHAGLPRDKVLAAVVRLLETTGARVGNAEYARRNGSYGLTTLRDGHATDGGGELRLRFRGKAGKLQEMAVDDRRLRAIVRRCRELPGQELFQYLDARGRPQAIGSADVNAYVRRATGEDWSAKDFRTWVGTVEAFARLRRAGRARGAAQARRRVLETIDEVAARLGNTRAVCRDFYIHPAVVAAYLDGSLAAAPRAGPRPAHLDAEEALLLRFLARPAQRPPALAELLRASLAAGRASGRASA